MSLVFSYTRASEMAVHQSTSAASASLERQRGARATRSAQRATWLGVLGLLGVLSVGRLVVTAFGYGTPAWFDEELNPLIALILHGQPIAQIDARQYGVVVFLVFDPAIRVLATSEGINLASLAAYANWVALLATGLAFGFAARRYAANDLPAAATPQAAPTRHAAATPPRASTWQADSAPQGASTSWAASAPGAAVTWLAAPKPAALRGSLPRLLILVVAWSSAVPLLYVIAQHMVDAWQLCFLSLSLFLFTGSMRQRRFAGLPLALATLTKLLPGLLLVYLFVRSWRAGLVGAAGIGLLLAIGQLTYGSLMGFGYPLAMLSGGADTITRWSTHFENNSIRGLLFKLGAGFRLQGDTTTYLLDARLVPVLNVLSYALSAALVAYLLYVAWRGRGRDSVARRSIEFSLAIFTMLLVSPHTAQDYLVTTLPVLAVWLYLWWRRLPRAWSIRQTVLGVLAALLVGVFLPMNLVARVLPLGWLVNVTDNAHNILFVDQIGSAIGAYDFFGFPGIGLVLGWLLLVRLERQTTA